MSAVLEIVAPPPIGLALLVGLSFPFFLTVTRYWTAIAGSPSTRYIAACIAAGATWVALLWCVDYFEPPQSRPLQLVNGGLVLLTSFVGFLALWGLLTRGCSLAILLALSRFHDSTDLDELASAYSGGRGLEWLTEKRLASLSRAGLIVRNHGLIRVTEPRGFLTARLHLWIVRYLGLKNFG